MFITSFKTSSICDLEFIIPLLTPVVMW
jgi:hypothetical protein